MTSGVLEVNATVASDAPAPAIAAPTIAPITPQRMRVPIIV